MYPGERNFKMKAFFALLCMTFFAVAGAEEDEKDHETFENGFNDLDSNKVSGSFVLGYLQSTY